MAFKRLGNVKATKLRQTKQQQPQVQRQTQNPLQTQQLATQQARQQLQQATMKAQQKNANNMAQKQALQTQITKANATKAAKYTPTTNSVAGDISRYSKGITGPSGTKLNKQITSVPSVDVGTSAYNVPQAPTTQYKYGQSFNPTNTGSISGVDTTSFNTVDTRNYNNPSISPFGENTGVYEPRKTSQDYTNPDTLITPFVTNAGTGTAEIAGAGFNIISNPAQFVYNAGHSLDSVYSGTPLTKSTDVNREGVYNYDPSGIAGVDNGYSNAYETVNKSIPTQNTWDNTQVTDVNTLTDEAKDKYQQQLEESLSRGDIANQNMWNEVNKNGWTRLWRGVADYIQGEVEEAQVIAAKNAGYEDMTPEQQKAYEIASTTGNMVPTIVLGAAGAGAAGAGTFAGLTAQGWQNTALGLMGAGAGNQAYYEAKNAGLDENKAQQYGFLKGAIEVATERMVGYNPAYGVGELDETYNAIADSLVPNDLAANALLKYFLNSGLGEGVEEAASEFLGVIPDQIMNPDDKRSVVDKLVSVMPQALESAKMGALSGLAMGMGQVYGEVNNAAMMQEVSPELNSQYKGSDAQYGYDQAIMNQYNNEVKRLAKANVSTMDNAQKAQTLSTINAIEQENGGLTEDLVQQKSDIVNDLAIQENRVTRDFLQKANQLMKRNGYTVILDNNIVDERGQRAEGYIDNNTRQIVIDPFSDVNNAWEILAHEVEHSTELRPENAQYQQAINTLAQEGNLTNENGSKVNAQSIREQVENAYNPSLVESENAAVLNQALMGNEQAIDSLMNSSKISTKAKNYLSKLLGIQNDTSEQSNVQRMFENTFNSRDAWANPELATNGNYSNGIETKTGDELNPLSEGGYDGYAMSNRARAAYEDGRKPASKINADDLAEINQILSDNGLQTLRSVAALKRVVKSRDTGGEWHHTGKFYNKTNFYDIYDAVEGITNEEIEAANTNKAAAKGSEPYEGTVDYITWTKNKGRFIPEEHTLENVMIEESGQFYKIYDKAGNLILKKKIGSNGTNVYKYKNNNEIAESTSENQKTSNEKSERVKKIIENSDEGFRQFAEESGMFEKTGRVDISGSGTIYKLGRKPSPQQYQDLSSFFDVGERIYKPTEDESGYRTYEWNGNDFVQVYEDQNGSKKYSKGIDTEQDNFRPDGSRRDLQAVHNISSDKLQKALELGGFPMPSIAITKDSIGHDQFGPISLVFDKNTIDPSNKLNKVYERDAWTSSYPSIDYDSNRKVAESIRSRVNKVLGERDSKVLNGYSGINLDPSNINDYLKRGDGDIASGYRNNNKLKYAFLKENGKAFAIPQKTSLVNEYLKSDDLEKIERKTKLSDEQLNGLIFNEYEFPPEQVEQDFNDYGKSIVISELENRIERMNKKGVSLEGFSKYYAKKIENIKNGEYDKIDGGLIALQTEASEIARGILDYRNNNYKNELDTNKFEEMINERVNQEEYEKWVREMFDGIVANKGIYKAGVDPFYSDGRRKTFKQTHEAETISNVIKYMRKTNLDAGADGRSVWSTQEVLPQLANNYRSLKSIIDNEGRLAKDEESQYGEKFKALSEEFDGYINDIAASNGMENDYAVKNGILNTMDLFLRGAKSPTDLMNKINKEGYEWKITREQAENVFSLKQKMSELPTDYLEAKPERAVGFNEVKEAVVPNYSSYDEIASRLEAEGIDVRRYDPNVEGDRQAKIDERNDLKFSKGIKTYRKNALKTTDDPYGKGRPMGMREWKNSVAEQMIGYTGDESKDMSYLLGKAYNQIKENGEVSEETREEIIEYAMYNEGISEELSETYEDAREWFKGKTLLIGKGNDLMDANRYMRAGIKLSTTKGQPIDEAWNEFAEQYGLETYLSEADIANEINDLMAGAVPKVHRYYDERNIFGEESEPDYSPEKYESELREGAARKLDRFIEDAKFRTLPKSIQNKILDEVDEWRETEPFGLSEKSFLDYRNELVGKYRNGEIDKNILNKMTEEAAPKITEEVNRVIEEQGVKIDNDEAYKKYVNDEVADQLRSLVEKGGKFTRGENPAVEIAIPKVNKKGTQNQQFARTIAESNAVAGNVEFERQVLEAIVNGDFEKTTVSNAELIEKAKNVIERDGFKNTINTFLASKDISANNVALGEVLLEYSTEINDENFLALNLKVSNMLSENGHALQAGRILKRLTPAGQMLILQSNVNSINNQIAENFKNKKSPVEINKQLAQEYIEATTEEQRGEIMDKINRDIAKQIPSTMSEKINQWRYLAMLANPRTHVRNIVGNAVFQPVVGTKNVINYGLQKAAQRMGIIDKVETSILNPTSAKDRALVKFGSEDFANVKGDFQQDQKYQINQDIIANRDYFSNKNIVGKGINNVAKFNNSALDMEDELFSKYRYARNLAQQMKAAGVTAETITDEQLSKFREKAYQEAMESVYRDFSATANAINKARNSSKGAKIFIDAVMPFTKTPMNIVSRMIEYSPVGLAATIAKIKQVRDGKMTATQYINNISKGVTGSGIVALGYLLASLGMFRVGDDDKSRKNNYESDLGEQDYALVMPDGSTYTIDWAAPAIAPLAIGAQLYNAVTGEGGPQFSDTGDIVNDTSNNISTVLDAAAGILDPITETSMLSGLSDSLSTYSGNKIAGVIGSAATSYVGQFFPTLGGQVARVIDDTRRSSYDNNTIASNVRKITNKIPFLSMLNEPYLDKTGEEMKQEDLGMGAAGRAILNMLSPGYYKSNTADEYDSELLRLYNANPDDNNNVIPTSYRNTTLGGTSYKFDAQESTEWNKLYGSTQRENVEAFIDSPVYSTLTDEERASIITKMQSYSQQVAKQNYFDNAGLNYTPDKNVQYAQEAANMGLDVYQYYIGTSFTSIKDDSGETIRNSQAMQSRDYWERLGVYDDIVQMYQDGLIETDDLKSAWGLNKTVINMDDATYTDNYQSLNNTVPQTDSEDPRNKTGYFTGLENTTTTKTGGTSGSGAYKSTGSTGSTRSTAKTSSGSSSKTKSTTSASTSSKANSSSSSYEENWNKIVSAAISNANSISKNHESNLAALAKALGIA